MFGLVVEPHVLHGATMRSLLLRCWVLSFVVFSTWVVAAPRAITPEDLWKVRRPSALDLSPDGSRLVFVVQDFNLEKNNSVSRLWILETATGETRQLTTAESSDGAPKWSPDGRQLVFTSKRSGDEQPALYLIRPDGGEAQKLLELPKGIASPQWLPDGKRIVFATKVLPKFGNDWDAMKAEWKKRGESKVSAKVSENAFIRYFDTWRMDDEATHLLTVDIETKQIVDLTPRWDRAFRFDGGAQFDVSPDGKWLALSVGTVPPPYHGGNENTDIYLLLIDDPSQEWKNLTADNIYSDDAPRFTPDGKAIVFGRDIRERNLPEFTKVMRVDLDDGRLTRLLADVDLSPQDWKFSKDGKTLYFRAEDRGRTKIFSATADGTNVKPVFERGTNTVLTVGEKQLYFLHQNFSRADEVYALDLATGKAEAKTTLNDALFAELKLGPVEEYTFAGAGGDTVQGWLIYPPDFDPTKKYPFLQLMHGGPATMVGDMWQPRWNAQVFVAPGEDAPDGFVATWVNRHGSTGFGEKFVQSIDGAWGEKPFEDVMKATDFLLEKHAFLDADRTAALGASYGGYLASWICGHTERFRTIVCHAGVTDFDTQFASDAALFWQDGVMDGSPWRRTEAYDRMNPMNYADQFKTPTLVIHGELDYRVPVAQGILFYGALQAQGVPSRLVYFPDENHWILKPQNSVFWYGEVRSWLVRWLK